MDADTNPPVHAITKMPWLYADQRIPSSCVPPINVLPKSNKTPHWNAKPISGQCPCLNYPLLHLSYTRPSSSLGYAYGSHLEYNQSAIVCEGKVTNTGTSAVCSGQIRSINDRWIYLLYPLYPFSCIPKPLSTAYKSIFYMYVNSLICGL